MIGTPADVKFPKLKPSCEYRVNVKKKRNAVVNINIRFMLCILNFSKSVVKLSKCNVADCISLGFFKSLCFKNK